ncbi:MAG: hypothetical protein QNJ60_04160 [Xenococcaceae cyanobacterium MO_188.B19]|nr:hypothetical protein [Xenococcaceae cyanobacterium MO_188.B19]
MNTRSFLLNICLGTGILFYNCFLVKNQVSAVSFKPSFSEFNLESILAVDLALEEDLNLILLGDSNPIESARQIDNLLVNEESNQDSKITLQIAEEEQPELLQSLIASLKELEFNKEIGSSEVISSEDNTFIILSQTDSANIYQDVYDFDTELTNDFQETPRNAPQNVVDNRKTPRLFKQKILTYTYKTPGSGKNNPANINQNTSSVGTVSSPSRNYSYTTVGNSSYYTQTQPSISNNINRGTLVTAGSTISGQSNVDFNNVDFGSRQISTIQPNNIPRLSIAKTKEQSKLEKKLAKQREKLRKKNEKLKKKLAKQRQKIAKQRAKEQQKRLEKQKERFQKIAEQQARLRNGNR